MIIVHNSLVYRIDGEEAKALMIHDTIQPTLDAITSRTEELVEEMDNNGVQFLNRQHFAILMRATREQDQTLLSLYSKAYTMMWDLFIEKTLRSGGNISDFIVNDMTVDMVKHHIHGENGLGFDLDRGRHIDCADCVEKADVTLKFFNAVILVQEKAYSDEGASQEDLVWLTDQMPDMAEGYPPMVVAIHTAEGTVVVGPKDTTPEFDEDLPMPTHVVKRTLN